ncbi:MAG: hypothetical protein NTX00_01285 [Candidatus Parcubacteria bacterium]|nr:hypothetical protein [Candidatus Parcubacteria bacterium]
MNHILMVYCFVGIWMLILYLTARLIHDYKITFFLRLCIYTISIYFSWQGIIILNDAIMMALIGQLPEISKQEKIFELGVLITCYLLSQVMMGDELSEKTKEEKNEKNF